jgi:hypothetical protein
MTIAFNLSTLLNSTTTTIVNITTATSLAGGAAGAVVYQSGTSATAFTSVGTAGQYLQSNGSSAPTWGAVATTNLAGGTAGAVVWQSGVTATAFTSVGTAGQVLQSNGSSAPTWSNTPSVNEWMVFALSDETTQITTGTSKVTMRLPYAATFYQLPRASLATAGAGSTATSIDIKLGGTSILATFPKLTIDGASSTSIGSSSATSLVTTTGADDAVLTMDVNSVALGARGLKVTVYLRRT